MTLPSYCFNLPDFRVISVAVHAFGQRRVLISIDLPPGCPTCGVISSRRKERRLQRLRDIPMAGRLELIWSKYRWFCNEALCERLSFFESTAEVPRYARSTGWLREQVISAILASGRAASETPAAYGVSWRPVRNALNCTAA
ncbi:transposase family protein [Crystallibacter degradans]|uniref:transposase family protein n=1 Tax=Crystallibacter degradans TaxID=2726743 RepID=UPI0014732E2C|nr:transposase family protein [Arthrobacter sp. SF27]NMR28129.1 transposase [Arthrobacter sp. SF27]